MTGRDATPTAEWEEIKSLFHEALELPAGERSAFVAGVMARDTSVGAGLETLLAAHQESDDFLETPAAMIPEALPQTGEPALPLGGRVGPYRLIREIGRGGMGAVYLATRDDGEFAQQVTVKLIKRGMDSDAILARFRHERQILAGLDHPNIARLLDGGTTEQGVPYFVMEYVRGQSISSFCEERALPTTERLALFRTVCAAVQYAHQHLIVHRDIKTSNILVAEDGTPKLLDFGIAKVLDPDRGSDGAAVTNTLHAMTPEYASPEQLRGAPVSTATDVYSLGVLLYELLTGRRPFESAGMRAEEIAHAVCNTDAPLPSAAAAPDVTRRMLRGDLDTIVLKAIQKDPERRYHSAEAFSDDIGRYLSGHPVTARRDTLGYRLSRFARRNRAGLAVAVLLLASLAGGFATTLRQARIAERERLRAERRFADVRALATTFLFEVHDAIATLPGATPARALLVNRGLASLDALARESQGDTLLQRELAAAYQRAGLVQGNTYNDNLGNSEAALKSYRASVTLLERSVSPDSRNAAALAALASGYEGLANLLNVTGDLKGSLQNLERALAAQQRAVALDTGNADYRKALANMHYEIGDTKGGLAQSNLGDTQGALASYRAAVIVRDSLRVKIPGDVETRGGLANTLMNLGSLEASLGDTMGVQHIRRGVGLLERIIADNPNDAFRRVNLLSGYMRLRRTLADDGQYSEAITMVRKVLATLQPMVTADPQNTLLQRNLGVTWNTLGQDLRALGDAKGAAQAHERAMTLFTKLRAADAKSTGLQQDVAFTHGVLADALLDAGDVSRAIGEYRRAVELKRSLKAAEPANPQHDDDLAPLHAGLGAALGQAGDSNGADAAYATAIPLAEAAAARPGSAKKVQSGLAIIYQGAGSLHARRATAAGSASARAAHCDAARVWLTKSLAAWERMRRDGPLPGAHRARPDSVAAEIAGCAIR